MKRCREFRREGCTRPRPRPPRPGSTTARGQPGGQFFDRDRVANPDGPRRACEQVRSGDRLQKRLERSHDESRRSTCPESRLRTCSLRPNTSSPTFASRRRSQAGKTSGVDAPAKVGHVVSEVVHIPRRVPARSPAFGRMQAERPPPRAGRRSPSAVERAAPPVLEGGEQFRKSSARWISRVRSFSSRTGRDGRSRNLGHWRVFGRSVSPSHP